MQQLLEVPDYYKYRRYPAKVEGRAGHFNVWARDAVHVNPEHVTWSPETVAIVAKEYQNDEWHAERAEQAGRPEVQVGEIVSLGGIVIEVPKRAAQYVDGVPCTVIADHTKCRSRRCMNPAQAHTCPRLEWPS
jgi:hypothetical protein